MILYIALLEVLFLWALTLISELQQKYYRERFAREDAIRNPRPDPYRHAELGALYIQAGVMTVNEARQWQQAWDDLATTPKHRVCWLPDGAQVTALRTGR